MACNDDRNVDVYLCSRCVERSGLDCIFPTLRPYTTFLLEKREREINREREKSKKSKITPGLKPPMEMNMEILCQVGVKNDFFDFSP